MTSNKTAPTINRGYRKITSKSPTTTTATSPKFQAGSPRLHGRPEIPQELMNFAKHLHSSGRSISAIQQIINEHDTSIYRIPNVKKFDYGSVNYNDLYKVLGKQAVA